MLELINLNELLMIDTDKNCRRMCCQIGFYNEIKDTNICVGLYVF